jgi:hypothetical protein
MRETLSIRRIRRPRVHGRNPQHVSTTGSAS